MSRRVHPKNEVINSIDQSRRLSWAVPGRQARKLALNGFWWGTEACAAMSRQTRATEPQFGPSAAYASCSFLIISQGLIVVLSCWLRSHVHYTR